MMFVNPHLLWVLVALPLGVAFMLYARWQRSRTLRELGKSPHRQLALDYRVRRFKDACVLIAITLLAISSAGPQWGIDPDAQTRRGRDLLVLLDLSRSMDAEHPSRTALALRSLDDLAGELDRHGGHRVALAGFASLPRLLFPFTHDSEHLRYVLKQIAERDYPSLHTPAPVSGTRIGAALKLAVDTCTQSRGPRPMIVLISDGDDPANDGEWQAGVELARGKNVTVHVVGVGDPIKGDTIPHGREALLFDDKPIVSKLDETLLRTIADQTGGTYLAARTAKLPLGTLLLHLLDADARRETMPTNSSVPVYEQQYAWFLLPAILLLVLASILSEGPRSIAQTNPVSNLTMRLSKRFGAVAASLLAMLCISAAPGPEIEALIRQGNDAFAQEKYEEAIQLYEQAEAKTKDPGLVAFNKAACLYRLGKHRDAIVCFRQALDDAEAPQTRRARAWFDLGNALMNDAHGRVDELADAVNAYRACLAQPNLSEGLRSSARHNLEIAQLRWLKARPKERDPKHDMKNPNVPKDPPDEPKNGAGKQDRYVPIEPDPTKKKSADNIVWKPGKPSDKLQAGRVQVLPDTDAVRKLTSEDAERTLDDLARRITAARRNLHPPLGPDRLMTKDW